MSDQPKKPSAIEETSVVRSRKTLKKVVAWSMGGMGLAAALLILFRWNPSQESPKHPITTSSGSAPRTKVPGSVTAHLRQDRFYSWPPQEIVSPSGGMPGSEIRATSPTRIPAEPAAPTREELKKESARSGDDLVMEDVRAILLDEKRSSALQLALIDKLRTQPPQEAV